eukprot:CCRYP_011829-RA/>CCRYP_011829-RA protein AED:0.48 eAED:0.70 QI:0/0/0/1/0/0/2/0/74
MASSHQERILQLMARPHLHAVLPECQRYHPRPHGLTTATHQIDHPHDYPPADSTHTTTTGHQPIHPPTEQDLHQ